MKNNIKTIKLFIGAASMFSLLVGCSDDFLKPEPLSLYEPTMTFSTVEGA